MKGEWPRQRCLAYHCCDEEAAALCFRWIDYLSFISNALDVLLPPHGGLLRLLGALVCSWAIGVLPHVPCEVHITWHLVDAHINRQ